MFLDTTVIVEILKDDDKVVEKVKRTGEKEALFFSIVQIGEIADWCRANGIDPVKVLEDVKEMVTITGITEAHCLEGSKIKQKQREAGKNKFSLIDGLIIASAKDYDQKLLTRDSDFEGLDNVIVF